VSLEPCFLEAAKLLGRESLSTDEKRQVVRSLKEVIDEQGKIRFSGENTERVQAAVARIREAEKHSALVQQRNSLRNLKTVFKEIESLNQWKEAPGKGVFARFVSSMVDKKGARDSLQAKVGSHVERRSTAFFTDLLKKGVLEDFVSKKFNGEVAEAIHVLNQEKPDLDAFAKFPENVRKMATVSLDHLEAGRLEHNAVGGDQGKLWGRISKKSWDDLKIRKAAGGAIPAGDKAHVQAFINDFKSALDLDMTFPGKDTASIDKVLAEVFVERSNGVHLRFEESAPQRGSGPSVARRGSKERQFFFKSAKDEMRMMEKYAKSSNLLENIMSEIQFTARDTAIMKEMGPNPIGNMEAAIQQTMKDLRNQVKADGSNAAEIGAKQADLQKTWDTVQKKIWPQITGEVNIAVNGTTAKASALIRTMGRVIDLPFAAVSSLADTITTASRLNYASGRDTFMAGKIASVASDFARAVKASREEIAHAMSSYALASEVMNAYIHTADHGGVVGVADKLAKMQAKYSGMNRWVDAVRLGAVTHQARFHLLQAGTSFENLPEGLASSLKQSGITAADWDLIRLNKGVDKVFGSEVMSLSAVRDIPLEQFESQGLVKAKLENLNSLGVGENELAKRRTQILEEARTSLADKYHAHFYDLAHDAASTPGYREQAVLNMGLKKGTLPGEVARHATTYKGFTFSYMFRHFGRELYGYTDQAVSLPQALSDMATLKNKSGAAGAANMIVFGTTSGILISYLNELARGKTISAPESADDYSKIVISGMLRSGALGFAGDIALGEAKTRYGHSALETFLGPSYTRLSDITNMVFDYKKDVMSGEMDSKWEKFVNRAGSFVMRNTLPAVAPGPLARTAFNYLIMYRANEMLSPGYLQRMEERLKQEQNKEFLIPPSSVIPTGGF